VGRTACTGHGLCADLLPERIQLEEWSFAIVRGDLPLGLALARTSCRAGLPGTGPEDRAN
jgi:ferredoxin